MKLSALLSASGLSLFIFGCEVTQERYDPGGPVIVSPGYPSPAPPPPRGGWDPRPVPGPGPGPGWPAGNRQQDAMNGIADGLQRMLNVVASYGPDNYTQLKGDIGDLGRSVNEVTRRIQGNERQGAIRDAYSNVLRDGETVEDRVRSINANRQIREAWSYVRSRIDYATDVINRGNDNPNPGDTASVGAMERASEDVINAVNEYLRDYEEASRQEALDLKASLRALRSQTDNFRNSARAGSQIRELRRDADEVLVRFNDANDRYTYLVSLDRRFRSDAFDQISAGVNRVVQSVR